MAFGDSDQKLFVPFYIIHQVYKHPFCGHLHAARSPFRVKQLKLLKFI